MTDWPIGLSTGCFYNRSIFDCLEEIRDGGFLMIEVCSSARHLDYHDKGAVQHAAQRIGALGMEAYSFHAPFASAIDITDNDEGRRRHAMNEIMAAAEAAAMIRARYFVIHPGPEEARGPTDGRIHRFENAARVLNQVARRCREMGVGFVLENMLPHLMFGHTSDILWIMGAIEEIGVGTCLDTGHAHLTGDIYRVMNKLSGHLEMVHANDNRGGWDDHLPPGKGAIDWRRLLNNLASTGFAGGIILELSGEGNRPPADILAEAREARLFLRGIARDIHLASPPTMVGPSIDRH